jgi:hypothetical protein
LSGRPTIRWSLAVIVKIMTTKLVIRTASGPILRFEKHSEYEDAEGWGRFIVSLDNSPVKGTVEVSDLGPNRWAAFFEEIAKEWKGWKGEKRIGSIEGDLSLCAKSDSLGHISLRVELKTDQGGADWFAAGTLVLEAGSLDTIAKSAKRLFNYESKR